MTSGKERCGKFVIERNPSHLWHSARYRTSEFFFQAEYVNTG